MLSSLQVNLLKHLSLIDEIIFAFKQAVFGLLLLDDRLLDELLVSLLVVSTHVILSRAQVGRKATIEAVSLFEQAEVLLLGEAWREVFPLDKLLVQLKL